MDQRRRRRFHSPKRRDAGSWVGIERGDKVGERIWRQNTQDLVFDQLIDREVVIGR